jgi:hypothetical protein
MQLLVKIGSSDDRADRIQQLRGIQSLNDQDKAHIFELLDAFLRDRKTKKAYAS